MKKFMLVSVTTILQLLSFHTASAHPGAGIVVDQYGNVYFTYKGLMKIAPDGKISSLYNATDGHWMCLDEKGIFASSQPKYFTRISPDGMVPAIIYAGGGSPIVISDGNLFYCGSEHGGMNPGAKTIIRETSKNKEAIFSTSLETVLDKLDEGITSLTAASNGELYIGCWNSILKISKDGNVFTLMHPVIIPGCDEDPADHRGDNRGKPLLRGIAVDKDGTIYAAATSCHCVIKITPDGKVQTILKSERPWSPTGVFVRDGNIYVLEYTNANGPRTEGWVPRVRKIGRDGKVTVLADLSSQNDKRL